MKKNQYKPAKRNKNLSTKSIRNYTFSIVSIVFEPILIIAAFVFLFLSCSLPSFGEESIDNDHKELKWIFDKYDVTEPISLIPKTNLEGWTAHYGKETNKGKWFVENGHLICNGSKGNHLDGDLVTKKEYNNFILNFEWINSQGGNSGIKYKLKDFGKIGGTINQNDNFTWLGCEYQILDDDNNREGKSNKGKNSAGSLYSVLAANTNKKLNPHGQRNTGRIVVVDDHVEHWLNGEKILEYNLESSEWKTALSKSKYGRAESFAKNKNGLIMLQDHGNKITFTKLVIREIKPKK
ncbi:MAG: DUF1080 domain-containing protein [Planctomycetaceae bacterium]|jgi:hypothetical protein|nr:DUF1080 domain-containing protein [Planctomycetaceae bacterium]